MQILNIICSTRGEASESSKLSRKIIDSLLLIEPEASLITRFIGGTALAHIDANYALAQHSASAEVSQCGSIALSEELIREVEWANIIVIGTPMHNFTVPSALKSWIDHIVRAGRTFNIGSHGKEGTLRDRHVFVAIASGGRFSGANARQPDFLTHYLTAVLGVVGLKELTFFSVQGTGLGAELLAGAWAQTNLALHDYFSIFRP